MNYSSIKQCDTANGPGVRTSLFVSGCTNYCKGCFNPETWDFNYGKPFTDDTIDKIIQYLGESFISGFTILGGDPLHEMNAPTVMDICQIVKEKYPEKSIWVYTGYLIEDLIKNPNTRDTLNYIDVLVDGPYVEEKNDLHLRFRGSSNQRIIDVQNTLLNYKDTIYLYTLKEE